jgi:hypothetical protein
MQINMLHSAQKRNSPESLSPIGVDANLAVFQNTKKCNTFRATNCKKVLQK